MSSTLHPDTSPPRLNTGAWATFWLCGIGLMLALGWVQPALGTYYRSIPEKDLQYLPKYCKLAVRLYGGYRGTGPLSPAESAQLKAFHKQSGCGGHLHHYCAGLWHLMDAQRSKPFLPRTEVLQSAVGEFAYMLGNCEASTPMRPEILTNQGRAFIGLKNYEAAVGVLTEAIRRDPKYVDAYLELSGIFIQLNSVPDAQRVLEDGLKQVPSSRAMQRHLKRIKDASAEAKGAAAAAGPPDDTPPLAEPPTSPAPANKKKH